MTDKNTARYAEIFAALGSEPRLEIVRLLFAVHPKGMIVGEIQAKLQIPNSTLSHHLEKLRQAGIVNCKKDKQWLWYSVNAASFEDLLSFLYSECCSNNSIVDPIKIISPKEPSMLAKLFGTVKETFEQWIRKVIGYERFTEEAIRSIELAQEESRRLGHKFIGTEQLLLGLIAQGTGITGQVLNSMDLNLENTRSEVEKIIGKGRGTQAENLAFTERAKQVLELSLQESRHLRDNYIGTEHLLLGIIREWEQTRERRGKLGVAAMVLENFGIDPENLQQRVRESMEH